MGKFPGFEESVQAPSQQQAPFNANAQAVRSDTLSILGEASKKLGMVLANDEAEVAFHNAKKAAAEAHLFAQLSANKNGSDFKSIYEKKYSELVAPIKNSLEPLSAARFSGKEAQLSTEMEIQAAQTAFEMKMKFGQEKNKERVNANASVIQENPYVAGKIMLDERNRFDQIVTTKQLPQSIADTDYHDARHVYSRAFIDGLLTKGKRDHKHLLYLREALHASESLPNIEFTPKEMAALGLEAKTKKLRTGYNKSAGEGEKVGPELSEVLRAITPDERMRALNQIDDILKEGTKKKVTGLLTELRMYSDKQLKGDSLNEHEFARAETVASMLPPEFQGEGKAIVAQIKVQGDIMAVGVAKGRFAAQQMIDEIKQQADAGPQSESQSAESIRRYTETHKLIEKLEKTLDAVDTARGDAAQLVQRYGDPELMRHKAAAADGDPEATKEWLDFQFAEQKKFGVTPAILTKQEADSVAKNIMDIVKVGTTEMVDQFLETLNEKYGDHAPLVIHDVMRLSSDKVPPSVALLGILPSKTSQMSVALNLRNSVEINKNFDDLAVADPGLKTEFAQKLQSTKENFVESFYGNDPKLQESPMVIALQDAVGIEARKLLTRRTHSEGWFGGFRTMSVGEAVDKAYENVVSNNFHKIPAGSNYIMVPKKQQYSEKAISAWVQHNLPANKGIVDKSIAPSMDPVLGKVTKQVYPVEWAQENTNQAGKPSVVFQRAARILTTPDGEGVQLVLDDGNGNYTAVLDKEGNPMMKSFSELSLYIPSKVGQYYPAPKKKEPEKKKKAPPVVEPVEDDWDPNDVGEEDTPEERARGLEMDKKAAEARKKRKQEEDEYDNSPAEE